jgi:hypothetical protein
MYSGLSSPHSASFSSTQAREIRYSATSAGMSSPVRFGDSNAEMRILCQSDSGRQTSRKCVPGLSGLPIARMRHDGFVVSASAATHSCSGMPHASSRMTRTSPWMPWNADWSVSAGLRP